jgi:hypothetical protein
MCAAKVTQAVLAPTPPLSFAKTILFIGGKDKKNASVMPAFFCVDGVALQHAIPKLS